MNEVQSQIRWEVPDAHFIPTARTTIDFIAPLHFSDSIGSETYFIFTYGDVLLPVVYTNGNWDSRGIRRIWDQPHTIRAEIDNRCSVPVITVEKWARNGYLTSPPFAGSFLPDRIHDRLSFFCRFDLHPAQNRSLCSWGYPIARNNQIYILWPDHHRNDIIPAVWQQAPAFLNAVPPVWPYFR